MKLTMPQITKPTPEWLLMWLERTRTVPVGPLRLQWLVPYRLASPAMTGCLLVANADGRLAGVWQLHTPCSN